MILRRGQMYRCQNRICGAEVRVERGSIDGSYSPTCCCGAVMKKPYEPPTLRKIKPTPELINLFNRKQPE